MPSLPTIVSIDTAMNAFSILKKFCENAGAGVKISSDLYDIEKFILSQKWENNNLQNRPVFPAGFDYSVDNESLETLYWLKWGFVIVITGYVYSQQFKKNAKLNWILHFEFW